MGGGGYLLLVVSPPWAPEHKEPILQRVAKGLLSWDVKVTGADLTSAEKACLSVKVSTGQHNELLIQHSTETLALEVLLHPEVSTLRQCFKNMMGSGTVHKHVVHAGYAFAGSGDWILQDGVFGRRDVDLILADAEIQQVLKKQRRYKLHVHCAAEGAWTQSGLSLNPPDIADHLAGAGSLISCLDAVLTCPPLSTLLPASSVVGNIRFRRPTLYVFPAGQGDCALFGVSGFTLLVDGGFSRRPCFWEFVRHLDRLDALLVTRFNQSNVCGLAALAQRKTIENVYPQVGYVFCNASEGEASPSDEELKKDRDELLVSVVSQGFTFVNGVRQMGLNPQPCLRNVDPLILYHKVGQGTLEMYVLSPPADSKEITEFFQKWRSNFEEAGMDKTSVPLCDVASVCALLVWRPAQKTDTVTRILLPGSAPQGRIFDGLRQLDHLGVLRSRTVTTETCITLKRPKVPEKMARAASVPPRMTKKPVGKPESPSRSPVPAERSKVGRVPTNKVIEQIAKKQEEEEKDKKPLKKPTKKAVRKTVSDQTEKTDQPKTPRRAKSEEKAQDVEKEGDGEKSIEKAGEKQVEKPLDKVEPKKATPKPAPKTKGAKEVTNKKAVEAKAVSRKAPEVPKAKPRQVPPKAPLKDVRSMSPASSTSSSPKHGPSKPVAPTRSIRGGIKPAKTATATAVVEAVQKEEAARKLAAEKAVEAAPPEIMSLEKATVETGKSKDDSETVVATPKDDVVSKKDGIEIMSLARETPGNIRDTQIQPEIEEVETTVATAEIAVEEKELAEKEVVETKEAIVEEVTTRPDEEKTAVEREHALDVTDKVAEEVEKVVSEAAVPETLKGEGVNEIPVKEEETVPQKEPDVREEITPTSLVRATEKEDVEEEPLGRESPAAKDIPSPEILKDVEPSVSPTPVIGKFREVLDDRDYEATPEPTDLPQPDGVPSLEDELLAADGKKPLKEASLRHAVDADLSRVHALSSGQRTPDSLDTPRDDHEALPVEPTSQEDILDAMEKHRLVTKKEVAEIKRRDSVDSIEGVVEEAVSETAPEVTLHEGVTAEVPTSPEISRQAEAAEKDLKSTTLAPEVGAPEEYQEEVVAQQPTSPTVVSLKKEVEFVTEASAEVGLGHREDEIELKEEQKEAVPLSQQAEEEADITRDHEPVRGHAGKPSETEEPLKTVEVVSTEEPEAGAVSPSVWEEPKRDLQEKEGKEIVQEKPTKVEHRATVTTVLEPVKVAEVREITERTEEEPVEVKPSEEQSVLLEEEPQQDLTMRSSEETKVVVESVTAVVDQALEQPVPEATQAVDKTAVPKTEDENILTDAKCTEHDETKELQRPSEPSDGVPSERGPKGGLLVEIEAEPSDQEETLRKPEEGAELVTKPADIFVAESVAKGREAEITDAVDQRDRKRTVEEEAPKSEPEREVEPETEVLSDTAEAKKPPEEEIKKDAYVTEETAVPVPVDGFTETDHEKEVPRKAGQEVCELLEDTRRIEAPSEVYGEPVTVSQPTGTISEPTGLPTFEQPRDVPTEKEAAKIASLLGDIAADAGKVALVEPVADSTLDVSDTKQEGIPVPRPPAEDDVLVDSAAPDIATEREAAPETVPSPATIVATKDVPTEKTVTQPELVAREEIEETYSRTADAFTEAKGSGEVTAVSEKLEEGVDERPHKPLAEDAVLEAQLPQTDVSEVLQERRLSEVGRGKEEGALPESVLPEEAGVITEHRTSSHLTIGTGTQPPSKLVEDMKAEEKPHELSVFETEAMKIPAIPKGEPEEGVPTALDDARVAQRHEPAEPLNDDKIGFVLEPSTSPVSETPATKGLEDSLQLKADLALKQKDTTVPDDKVATETGAKHDKHPMSLEESYKASSDADTGVVLPEAVTVSEPAPLESQHAEVLETHPAILEGGTSVKGALAPELGELSIDLTEATIPAAKEPARKAEVAVTDQVPQAAPPTAGDVPKATTLPDEHGSQQPSDNLEDVPAVLTATRRASDAEKTVEEKPTPVETVVSEIMAPQEDEHLELAADHVLEEPTQRVSGEPLQMAGVSVTHPGRTEQESAVSEPSAPAPTAAPTVLREDLLLREQKPIEDLVEGKEPKTHPKEEETQGGDELQQRLPEKLVGETTVKEKVLPPKETLPEEEPTVRLTSVSDEMPLAKKPVEVDAGLAATKDREDQSAPKQDELGHGVPITAHEDVAAIFMPSAIPSLHEEAPIQDKQPVTDVPPCTEDVTATRPGIEVSVPIPKPDHADRTTDDEVGTAEARVPRGAPTQVEDADEGRREVPSAELSKQEYFAATGLDIDVSVVISKPDPAAGTAGDEVETAEARLLDGVPLEVERTGEDKREVPSFQLSEPEDRDLSKVHEVSAEPEQTETISREKLHDERKIEPLESPLEKDTRLPEGQEVPILAREAEPAERLVEPTSLAGMAEVAVGKAVPDATSVLTEQLPASEDKTLEEMLTEEIKKTSDMRSDIDRSHRDEVPPGEPSAVPGPIGTLEKEEPLELLEVTPPTKHHESQLVEEDAEISKKLDGKEPSSLVEEGLRPSKETGTAPEPTPEPEARQLSVKEDDLVKVLVETEKRQAVLDEIAERRPKDARGDAQLPEPDSGKPEALGQSETKPSPLGTSAEADDELKKHAEEPSLEGGKITAIPASDELLETELLKDSGSPKTVEKETLLCAQADEEFKPSREPRIPPEEEPSEVAAVKPLQAKEEASESEAEELTAAQKTAPLAPLLKDTALDEHGEPPPVKVDEVSARITSGLTDVTLDMSVTPETEVTEAAAPSTDAPETEAKAPGPAVEDVLPEEPQEKELCLKREQETVMVEERPEAVPVNEILDEVIKQRVAVGPLEESRKLSEAGESKEELSEKVPEETTLSALVTGTTPSLPPEVEPQVGVVGDLLKKVEPREDEPSGEEELPVKGEDVSRTRYVAETVPSADGLQKGAPQVMDEEEVKRPRIADTEKPVLKAEELKAADASEMEAGMDDSSKHVLPQEVPKDLTQGETIDESFASPTDTGRKPQKDATFKLSLESPGEESHAPPAPQPSEEQADQAHVPEEPGEGREQKVPFAKTEEKLPVTDFLKDGDELSTKPHLTTIEAGLHVPVAEESRQEPAEKVIHISEDTEEKTAGKPKAAVDAAFSDQTREPTPEYTTPQLEAVVPGGAQTQPSPEHSSEEGRPLDILEATGIQPVHGGLLVQLDAEHEKKVSPETAERRPLSAKSPTEKDESHEASIAPERTEEHTGQISGLVPLVEASLTEPTLAVEKSEAPLSVGTFGEDRHTAEDIATSQLGDISDSLADFPDASVTEPSKLAAKIIPKDVGEEKPDPDKERSIRDTKVAGADEQVVPKKGVLEEYSSLPPGGAVDVTPVKEITKDSTEKGAVGKHEALISFPLPTDDVEEVKPDRVLEESKTLVDASKKSEPLEVPREGTREGQKDEKVPFTDGAEKLVLTPEVQTSDIQQTKEVLQRVGEEKLSDRSEQKHVRGDEPFTEHIPSEDTGEERTTALEEELPSTTDRGKEPVPSPVLSKPLTEEKEGLTLQDERKRDEGGHPVYDLREGYGDRQKTEHDDKVPQGSDEESKAEETKEKALPQEASEAAQTPSLTRTEDAAGPIEPSYRKIEDKMLIAAEEIPVVSFSLSPTEEVVSEVPKKESMPKDAIEQEPPDKDIGQADKPAFEEHPIYDIVVGKADSEPTVLRKEGKADVETFEESLKKDSLPKGDVPALEEGPLGHTDAETSALEDRSEGVVDVRIGFEPAAMQKGSEAGEEELEKVSEKESMPTATVAPVKEEQPVKEYGKVDSTENAAKLSVFEDTTSGKAVSEPATARKDSAAGDFAKEVQEKPPPDANDTMPTSSPKQAAEYEETGAQVKAAIAAGYDLGSQGEPSDTEGRKESMKTDGRGPVPKTVEEPELSKDAEGKVSGEPQQKEDVPRDTVEEEISPESLGEPPLKREETADTELAAKEVTLTPVTSGDTATAQREQLPTPVSAADALHGEHTLSGTTVSISEEGQHVPVSGDQDTSKVPCELSKAPMDDGSTKEGQPATRAYQIPSDTEDTTGLTRETDALESHQQEAEGHSQPLETVPDQRPTTEDSLVEALQKELPDTAAKQTTESPRTTEQFVRELPATSLTDGEFAKAPSETQEIVKATDMVRTAYDAEEREASQTQERHVPPILAEISDRPVKDPAAPPVPSDVLFTGSHDILGRHRFSVEYESSITSVSEVESGAESKSVVERDAGMALDAKTSVDSSETLQQKCEKRSQPSSPDDSLPSSPVKKVSTEFSRLQEKHVSRKTRSAGLKARVMSQGSSEADISSEEGEEGGTPVRRETQKPVASSDGDGKDAMLKEPCDKAKDMVQRLEDLPLERSSADIPADHTVGTTVSETRKPKDAELYTQHHVEPASVSSTHIVEIHAAQQSDVTIEGPKATDFETIPPVCPSDTSAIRDAELLAEYTMGQEVSQDDRHSIDSSYSVTSEERSYAELERSAIRGSDTLVDPAVLATLSVGRLSGSSESTRGVYDVPSARTPPESLSGAGPEETPSPAAGLSPVSSAVHDASHGDHAPIEKFSEVAPSDRSHDIASGLAAALRTELSCVIGSSEIVKEGSISEPMPQPSPGLYSVFPRDTPGKGDEGPTQESSEPTIATLSQAPGSEVSDRKDSMSGNEHHASRDTCGSSFTAQGTDDVIHGEPGIGHLDRGIEEMVKPITTKTLDDSSRRGTGVSFEEFTDYYTVKKADDVEGEGERDTHFKEAVRIEQADEAAFLERPPAHAEESQSLPSRVIDTSREVQKVIAEEVTSSKLEFACPEAMEHVSVLEDRTQSPFNVVESTELAALAADPSSEDLHDSESDLDLRRKLHADHKEPASEYTELKREDLHIDVSHEVETTYRASVRKEEGTSVVEAPGRHRPTGVRVVEDTFHIDATREAPGISEQEHMEKGSRRKKIESHESSQAEVVASDDKEANVASALASGLATELLCIAPGSTSIQEDISHVVTRVRPHDGADERDGGLGPAAGDQKPHPSAEGETVRKLSATIEKPKKDEVTMHPQSSDHEEDVHPAHVPDIDGRKRSSGDQQESSLVAGLAAGLATELVCIPQSALHAHKDPLESPPSHTTSHYTTIDRMSAEQPPSFTEGEAQPEGGMTIVTRVYKTVRISVPAWIFSPTLRSHTVHTAYETEPLETLLGSSSSLSSGDTRPVSNVVTSTATSFITAPASKLEHSGIVDLTASSLGDASFDTSEHGPSAVESRTGYRITTKTHSVAQPFEAWGDFDMTHLKDTGHLGHESQQRVVSTSTLHRLPFEEQTHDAPAAGDTMPSGPDCGALESARTTVYSVTTRAAPVPLSGDVPDPCDVSHQSRIVSHDPADAPPSKSGRTVKRVVVRSVARPIVPQVESDVSISSGMFPSDESLEGYKTALDESGTRYYYRVSTHAAGEEAPEGHPASGPSLAQPEFEGVADVMQSLSTLSGPGTITVRQTVRSPKRAVEVTTYETGPAQGESRFEELLQGENVDLYQTLPEREEFYRRVECTDTQLPPEGSDPEEILRFMAAQTEKAAKEMLRCPVYEETEEDEERRSTRSAGPVIEEQVYVQELRPDYAELIQLSGGTTPSDPQSPRSPLDVRARLSGECGTSTIQRSVVLEETESRGSTMSTAVRLSGTADDPSGMRKQVGVDGGGHSSATFSSAAETVERTSGLQDAPETKEYHYFKMKEGSEGCFEKGISAPSTEWPSGFGEDASREEPSASRPGPAPSSDTGSSTVISSFKVQEWDKPLGLPTPPDAPHARSVRPPIVFHETSFSTGPAPPNPLTEFKIRERDQPLGLPTPPDSSRPNDSHKTSKANRPDDAVYVDLTYVPHHGDPQYCGVEFFNRVRARYYVLSGTSPSQDVLNALLEAKRSWGEPDVPVTVIPTYETDTLCYWIALNQDALEEQKIDVAPSASRCTINLQNHETSCAAYRLEF